MNDIIAREINDAWLNVEFDESSLFNPMQFITQGDPDLFHLRLTWLLSCPEYFSFICKQIFNIDLLPAQSLMLHEMWNRKFPMLIASRGFGKSFILSLYALLRALIFPKRKITFFKASVPLKVNLEILLCFSVY